MLRRVPSLRARREAASRLPDDPRDLLGKRLSLLYRIEDEEHPMSEAVGVLQQVDEGVLVLARADGSTRQVPLEDIVTLKVIS